ncbi:alkaline phosphatase PafA [Sungkyunkwania multivorans]|uniref:Alkaline phosphatase PafA n=1 Tax=Sungkyunkwania multivorans TaxID=1173618 RepID=A0ABW3CY67_9FLAO
MKRVFLIALSLLMFWQSQSQNNSSSIADDTPFSRPKLVVGIVVDQMRYDYLTRFWHRYGDDGFKRMIDEGYNFKNNHYNYVPTYTGPGHASVFTGTTPANHGIISNDWYSKAEGKMVYCSSDPNVIPVGTTSSAGKMSPMRMKTTTVADQNRLHTQFKGKTIGIAIKDRGAIMPAGHSANAAYWFHGKNEGVFISSSFYMEKLPEWVQKFNASKKIDTYMKPWETLYDISSYDESGADDNSYEGVFKGEKSPVFPHDLPKYAPFNGNYDIIKATPFGNSLTTDFALAAIDGESLGADEVTDFLTLSFSSTDYVGHQYGVNSKEVEDTYLRLDKDLERLFNYLDIKVGKDAYTVFLTADHGAVHVPGYLQSKRIPSGYVGGGMKQKLNKALQDKYGKNDFIRNISNKQIFFDRAKLKLAKVEVDDVSAFVASQLVDFPQVDKVFTSKQMRETQYENGIAALVQRGYNQKRSGDVLIVFDPAVISHSRTGSTHGSGLRYDTHVPLLFFGKGINRGSTTTYSAIEDIAPTIAALIGTAFPNGATGKVLSKVID